jgi:coenzyme F420-reducing hydrogenase alpha subunit
MPMRQESKEEAESHALHVFVLALPDILGHPSVISLAEDLLRATAKQGLSAGADDSTIEQRLAIVARAYDPCISCSVHVISVS